MRKIFSSIAVGLISLTLLAVSVNAATIGFSPSASAGNIGDPLSIDIVISDLGGEIVSAYDLDVTYDDAILSATGVSFTAALGDEGFFEAFYDSDLSTSGIVDLAGVSLLSDADLLALQGGDAVTLASLEFTVIANGASVLDFNFDAFNDVKGSNAQILPLDVNPGSVAAPIPEPSAALLFFVGILVTRGVLQRRTV